MNTNSINSYKSERDSGNITKRQQQVVDFLNLVKGATAKQITKAVPNGWKRCSELVSMGLVRVCGNVKDPDTKKMVSVYELTGQQMLLPNPSVKKPSRKELETHIMNLELKLKSAEKYQFDLGYSVGYLKAMGEEPKYKEVKIFGLKIW